MTIDIHIKGSRASHNRGKEYTSAIGIKRMSDEEFDREMGNMKANLDMLMKFL